MARVRLVVEYDMDIDGEPTSADLAQEHTDWVVGNVTIEDCIGAEARPIVTVEVVEQTSQDAKSFQSWMQLVETQMALAGVDLSDNADDDFRLMHSRGDSVRVAVSSLKRKYLEEQA